MQQQTFFLVFGPDLTQKFLYVSFFPLDILPCMKICKEKSANIIYKQIMWWWYDDDDDDVQK